MMIKINKLAQNEPQSWINYRRTPGVAYQPSNDLRNALLAEQGYICAYCMRRIPARDISVDATSKIEHILSQEDRPDLQLNFSNMAICCPGNLNNEEHCDKLKGGGSVSFNLHTPVLQQSIKYSSKDGTIESTNLNWDNEMNDLLNLNHALLKHNRKLALAGVIAAISSIAWTNAIIRRKYQEWSQIDGDGKLKEFCGIVIWYLNKKL